MVKVKQAMPQMSVGSLKRSADILLNDDHEPVRKQVSPVTGLNRPRALQDILNVVGDMLMSPQAPAMASYVAGKVYQRLERRGVVPDLPGKSEAPEHLNLAVANVVKSLPRFADMGEQLRDLTARLQWRGGRGGPYASLNFEKAHAHAVVVGPGGLEERSDVRLGLTLMAPYSRFPDHVQYHSRVFMLLSDGEVSLDDSHWFQAAAGAIFFNEAGCKFAMRCTAAPLLAVWAHVEDASL